MSKSDLQNILVVTGVGVGLDSPEPEESLEDNFQQLFPEASIRRVGLDEIEFLIGKHVELFVDGGSVYDFDKIILYGSINRNLRIAYPLAKTLLANHSDVFTRGAENYRGVDKLSQYVELSLMGLSIPKTYYASPEKLIANAKEQIGFPIVVKDILSSQGGRNFLIHSQSDLEALKGEIEQDRYVAQEFIENDGDLRVLINSKGDTFAFKRIAQDGSHLNNTSQGAKTEVIEKLPIEIVEICKRILKDYNLQLAGIDIILKDGKYWVLETNTQPQIFSGPYIDSKISVIKNLL